MTAVYIILSILFLLLLLLATRIKVTLLYQTDVRVYLKFWFIRIHLYPRKKKVRVRDFAYKKLKKKKRESTPPINAAKNKHEPKKELTLKQKTQYYVRIFNALYEKFLKYFRIDVARIRLSVATGDAAQTAILYGVIAQSLAYVCEILHQHTNFHPKNRTAISISPDFVGEKSHADCNVTFSLRVWQIAHLGLRFARAHFHNKENKPTAVNK